MTIAIDTHPPRRIERIWQELPTRQCDGIGVQQRGRGHAGEIWIRDGDEAVRLGVPQPREHVRGHFLILEGEDLLLAVQRKYGEWYDGDESRIIQPLNIPPGRYFPRMARPNHQHPGDQPGPFYPADELAHDRAIALNQFAILSDQLQMAFRTAHPGNDNLGSYGNEFRNILILAATEVEGQWQGVLRANSYRSRGSFFTTKDYVKLEPAFRLRDYAVEFIQLPWCEPVIPFSGWEEGAPTQSLGWYDAYNKVKHDRGANFPLASIRHAMQALAAVYVIIGAQFGFHELRYMRDFRDLYRLESIPEWTIGDTHGWTGSRSPSAGEPINYPFPG